MNIIKINNRVVAWLILIVVAAVSIGYVNAETAARKKARYYYSAGSVQQALGNESAAYEYYKKAYETDPTYVEGASAYGSRRLYIGLDTLQSTTELNRSLEMMKGYTDMYPEDQYENLFYGYVAGQLDHDDEGIRVLERTYALHPQSSNILFALSDAYAHKQDWANAIDAIDRYEKQAGGSSQITTRKLSFMLVQGDTVRAINEMRRLTDMNPKDASYYILRANLYDVVNMPDSALKYYLRAEALEPESGGPKLALAGHYSSQGDSVSYDKKMYEVLLTDDVDFNQKADLVAEYLHSLLQDNQDHKRGDYLFSVLEEQYPHEPRVLDLSARYNAAKGNFKEAREQIAYAIDRDPTNISYWGQLMTYQAADGDADEALNTFERAKGNVIPDEQLKNYYISVAQMAEKYDKAASMIREMMSEIQPGIQPDSVITLGMLRHDISAAELDKLSILMTTLGDVYYMATDTTRAFKVYENALVLDDSNNMAKNNYAYFLSTGGGDLDKALELSKSSISGFDALNPTYLDTYAWINFKKGNLEEALEYQEKALEQIEDSPYPSAEIYEHYGDIKAALDDWNTAVEYWRKAQEIREKAKEADSDDYKLTETKIKDGVPKMKPEDAKDKNISPKDDNNMEDSETAK